MASGNLSMSAMQIRSNAALLGGALFISADLSDDVELSGLAFQDNSAILGEPCFSAAAALTDM